MDTSTPQTPEPSADGISSSATRSTSQIGVGSALGPLTVITRTMKMIMSLLLIAILISSSSCITYCTIKRAKGEQIGWSDAPDERKHPAYYCFIPMTVPLDIATTPIQIFIWPEVIGGGTYTNHLDTVKKH
jgi:hypothetical protein